MKRLCFGSLMVILYQARNPKVTNESICNALFSCFGKSTASYDSSTPGHLKAGKINVPPDVIEAAMLSDGDETDKLVNLHIIPLIKISHKENVVRAIKDLLSDDTTISEDTIVGYITGYEKKNLLIKSTFALSSLLAGVLRFVSVDVKNNECKEGIKEIPKNFVESQSSDVPVYFEASDAKPKTDLTLTLTDPDFNRVFDKVSSMMVNTGAGASEIEIYKVADVTNCQLRFRRMKEYLMDHIGEYVFSRSKASRFEKTGKTSAIGVHAFKQFIAAYNRSKETVLGEILLYVFLEQGLNAPKIISKIEIDDNGFLSSKSDGVHLLAAGFSSVPYDQLVFGASDIEGQLVAAVDRAFTKIQTIKDNDYDELQTVERTCHNDIYDDNTREFMVDLILNGRRKPDMAFGVFLGYTMRLATKITDNNKYRVAVENQLIADINAIQPYIINKISSEGFDGYNFYFYVIPFNDADTEKIEIVDDIVGGV